MTYQISITPVNDNSKKLQTALHLIVVFVVLISGVFLLLYRSVLNSLPDADRASLAVLPVAGWKAWLMIALSVLLFWIVVGKNKWLQQKNFSRLLRIFEFGLLAAFAFTTFQKGIFTPGFFYAVVCLLIIYSFFKEAKAHKISAIIFDLNGVLIPRQSTPKKLLWQEVERVLLKHQVLSVDCYDNRLYQWNVNTETTFHVGAFQEFCNAQIEQAKDKRAADDW